MDTERDPAGLEFLSKAGAVLDVLEREGEATVAGIATALGSPISSTYRLVSDLGDVGWVEPSPIRGRYRLGLMLMRVGGVVEDRIDVREAARAEMIGLRDQLGLSSVLCVPRGRRSVCIERINGPAIRSDTLRLGDSLPLTRGAAQLAILSFLPEPERLGVLDDTFADVPPAAAPTRAELLRAVARIQHDGFVVSVGDVTPGIAAVGAPVFNHRGELEASLSVSGLSLEVTENTGDIADLLVSAAHRVSRNIGFDGVA